MGALISRLLMSASFTVPMLSGLTGAISAIACASALRVSDSDSVSASLLDSAAAVVSASLDFEHPLITALTVAAATTAASIVFLNFLIMCVLLILARRTDRSSSLKSTPYGAGLNAYSLSCAARLLRAAHSRNLQKIHASTILYTYFVFFLSSKKAQLSSQVGLG